MRNGSVFVYGAAPRNIIGFALASLPFYALHIMWAFEHFGEGLKINWSDGKMGARRRNYIAAMRCNAVIIVGRPKFTDSVVKAFRQRGRRIFWFNPKNFNPENYKLVEVEVHDSIQRNLSALPKEATWEPDLWEMQRAEKHAAMQSFLDEHPWAQRKPDSIPTFGWMEVFNEDEIECSEDDIFKRCRRSKLSEATL